MVRVRIAPSPTGNLHIGTARTALFNWLFAKKNNGEFILRMEDTDIERSDKKYEKDIINGLNWLGLGWDNKEIFRQSERLDKYEHYLKQLLESGKAFWCNHSKEELEKEQKKQMERKEAPRHVCDHKKDNLKTGQVIRLANDPYFQRITEASVNQTDFFPDLIRGEIHTVRYVFGDFSIAKDLRTPLYNFAVVIDDIDMQISHVIRGEDHISNTPKQILIYEALAKKQPQFAHLPLILSPDRSKLSKRHGATSVSDFKKDYLPEAMINFMGFLGHTYSKDIISSEEMINEFELEKVHKSGAIFDAKKLNWINSQYIKRLPLQEFKRLANVPDLPDKAIPLITERLEKLSDVSNMEYFKTAPIDVIDIIVWKNSTMPTMLQSLTSTGIIINRVGTDDKEKLRSELDKSAIEKFGGDRGVVYWPFRVAETGKEKSPDPVDIAYVLGKEKVLERIENAKKQIE